MSISSTTLTAKPILVTPRSEAATAPLAPPLEIASPALASARPSLLADSPVPPGHRIVEKWGYRERASRYISRKYLMPFMEKPRLAPPFIAKSVMSHAHWPLGTTQVAFPSADGLNLRGYWWPAEAGPKRQDSCVILAHGHGLAGSNMLPLAQKLHEEGHTVFAFDFRGHGQSSGAKPCSFGYHEGKDVLGAVRYVADNHPKEAKNITLLGHSMGASAMMLMPDSLKDIPDGLKDINTHVKRLILDSPYNQLNLLEHRAITRALSSGFPLSNRVANAVTSRFHSDDYAERLELPKPLGDFRCADTLVKSPALAEKPILFMHGDRDSITPYRHAEEIQSILRGQKGVFMHDMHFVTLNANHCDFGYKLPSTGSVPFSTSRKYVPLRDETHYMNAVLSHLRR